MAAVNGAAAAHGAAAVGALSQAGSRASSASATPVLLDDDTLRPSSDLPPAEAATAATAPPTEPTAAAGEGGSDAEAEEAAVCPICLGPFQDRALAGGCIHAFCFACLRQWSRVARSCPLCKTPFSRIVHNIRSETVFSVYELPPPELSDRGRDPRIILGRDARGRPIYALAVAPLMQRRRGVSERRRPWRRSGRTHLPDDVERRRVVYAARLYVRPESDPWVQANQRSLEPRVFLSTANQQRLQQWLEREVLALVGAQHKPFVMTYMHSLLRRIDIRNREVFVDAMRPFFFEQAGHLWHELVHFAQSPFSMQAYDQHAQYDDPRGLLPRVGGGSGGQGGAPPAAAGAAAAATNTATASAAAIESASSRSEHARGEEERSSSSRRRRRPLWRRDGTHVGALGYFASLPLTSAAAAAADAAGGSSRDTPSGSGGSAIESVGWDARNCARRQTLGASRWDSPSPPPQLLSRPLSPTGESSSSSNEPAAAAAVTEPRTPPHVAELAARLYRDHVRRASASVFSSVAQQRTQEVEARARSPVRLDAEELRRRRLQHFVALTQEADDRMDVDRNRRHRADGTNAQERRHESSNYKRSYAESSRSATLSAIDDARTDTDAEQLEKEVAALRAEIEKQQKRLLRLKEHCAVADGPAA